MKVKLGLLHLSEDIKWEKWPTWLKGLYLFWPSLGPAFLFLTRTPLPTDGTGELSTILANIEYQNYFISIFLGLWAINLVILGLTWLVGGVISEAYRYHISSRTMIPVTKKKVKGKIGNRPFKESDGNDGKPIKLKKRER